MFEIHIIMTSYDGHGMKQDKNGYRDLGVKTGPIAREITGCLIIDILHWIYRSSDTVCGGRRPPWASCGTRSEVDCWNEGNCVSYWSMTYSPITAVVDISAVGSRIWNRALRSKAHDACCELSHRMFVKTFG